MKTVDFYYDDDVDEPGWYFMLSGEGVPYGPFSNRGEASTEYQTLMHEIGGYETVD